MNDFKISRAAFSEFFWQQVGIGRSLPYALGQQLEELRAQADYNTGSLTDDDIYDLSALVRYFEPTVVCEIGTFIGRSTHTIADNMKAGVIWTCDGSNALDLPAPENKNVTIRQFKKTSSTEMFAKAMTERQKFDLFYIDGRLSQRDVELMADCMYNRSVIVLDDFEGVEKGVANASMLLSSVAADFTLIYPKLERKTAVLLPLERIRFVRQV